MRKMSRDIKLLKDIAIRHEDEGLVETVIREEKRDMRRQ